MIGSVARGTVIALLRAVRVMLLPFQGMVSLTPRVCKYEPSCSCYAEQAIHRHGIAPRAGVRRLAAPALQPVVERRV